MGKEDKKDKSAKKEKKPEKASNEVAALLYYVVDRRSFGLIIYPQVDFTYILISC